MAQVKLHDELGRGEIAGQAAHEVAAKVHVARVVRRAALEHFLDARHWDALELSPGKVQQGLEPPKSLLER